MLNKIKQGNLKENISKIIPSPKSPYWYIIAGIIHLSAIIFIYVNLHLYENLIKYPLSGIFQMEGDTPTYYGPLESAFLGEGYTSTCRMPALLPIYFPLRLLFNIFWTKNIIIGIQIALSIAASVSIAKIGYKLTKSMFVFNFIILAYSSGFLLSKLTVMGYMDSLAVSLLILGYYVLICKKNTTYNILFAGVLFGWSIFFRQIIGLNLVFVALWLFIRYLKIKEFKKLFPTLSYSCCLLFCSWVHGTSTL